MLQLPWRRFDDGVAGSGRKMRTRTFTALGLAAILIRVVGGFGGRLGFSGHALMIRAMRGGFGSNCSRCLHGVMRMGHGMSELTDDEPTHHQENHCPAMPNRDAHEAQSSLPPGSTQRLGTQPRQQQLLHFLPRE